MDVESFSHNAFYNDEKGRVEMHLVSLCDQKLVVDGEVFRLMQDETLHTENSYKYDLSEFETMAEMAGFGVERVWMDSQQLFSVQCLAVK